MKLIRIILLLCTISLSTQAQDTFSIVAIDTATGEIGSAGASCIANSFIISIVVKNVGAIHTQASYLPGNQQNGLDYLIAGKSPDSIIHLLKKNDVQNDSSRRQYGVVCMNYPKHTAAFTGDSCLDYKNHIIRPTYTIQGNILLGQYVLDSMEARFLREPRSLAYKLMAALQGANIPGADSRCLPNNKPAISAFIRLSKPTDSNDVDYMLLNVPVTKAKQNPIDSLQKRFDAFMLMNTAVAEHTSAITTAIYPNPATEQTTLRYYSTDNRNATLVVVDAIGKVVYQKQLPQGNEYTLNLTDLPKGLYFYSIQTNSGTGSGKLVVQ